MSNEKRETEHKTYSKKHMARIEKEKRQRKVLLIGIISTLAIIVLLIAYGVLSKTVLLAGRAVAKVNSNTITVEQFQKRVRYERLSLEQTFLNYQLSSFASFFQSQLLEVQNQLDDYLTFGENVLDEMIDEQLIIQESEKLGLTVSEEEINKELEESFGYYANGTPTPEPTLEYRPTSTFSATQLAIITPTYTATVMPTETSMPTETAAPDVTESVDATDAPVEATATVTVTPTATESAATSTPSVEPTATTIPPTSTPYTYEGYQNLYATVVANLNEQTKFNDSDFRDYVLMSLYNQKLFEYVTKDISSEQEMVWARHILVATEADANTVLEKLNQGEDFATLAAYYSQDTANSYTGGDLGWIYKGQMVEEFENIAFAMEVGEISAPVQTSFGYHIIQILGHEVRQLSADELSSAKSTAYSKYLENLRTNANIVKKEIWASVVPSDPTIPTEYRISQ